MIIKKLLRNKERKDDSDVKYHKERTNLSSRIR